MSQYPPGGSQGYPPNFPPGGPQGFGPQGYSLPPATTTSGAAITSLVCGLLMCIPGVTGLIAVLTGIIGISATSNPAVKGRGMAIAGLILGLLSLGGWGLFGSGIYAMLRGSGPERAFAKSYIADLAAGNVDQCVQNSTANLPKDTLDAASKRMQSWGTLQDTTIIAFSFNSAGGTYAGSTTGICKFNSGQPHTFQMMVTKDSNGQLKADSFLWQN
ncbi:MAG: DUF4190 domain-containing protein [Tepidisphaeraceae bacterium]|jgi:uncharacterized protein DUF4190